MSLINDALKRAKATQPKSASADGPALLRPDFAPLPPRSIGSNDFLLPALLIVILLLAALLLWQWFHGEAGELKVRARTIPTPEAIQPSPAADWSATPHSPQSPVPLSLTQNTNVPTTTPEHPVAAPPPNPEPAIVNPQSPPPPSVTNRLQSIFYRAQNPSAVINGKTLFIGDRLGDAHVIAIGKESATLVTASGQTNVLELP